MPTLVVKRKGTELCRVTLGRDALLIGRLKPADICLDDPLVSGAHAKVYLSGGRWVVRDLTSRNGTYLNGGRITESTLNVGDELFIGNAVIAVAADGADEVAPVDGTAAAGAASGGVPGIESGAVGDGTGTDRLGLDTVRDSGFDDARAEDDERLSLLWHAAEMLGRLADRPAIYAAIHDLLARAFPGARPFVLEREEGGRAFVPVAGSDGGGRAPSRTVVAEAAASLSVILAKSLSSDERFKTADSVVSTRIATAMAAPLVCRSRATAVIYVDRLGGRSFGTRDQRLLGLIANQVASALESAALVAELKRTNQDLAEAHEKLARWSHELERKVEERTAEVRRQTGEIAALAAEKDELLGIAAHDIRGPLTTILGFIEIARANIRTSALDALDGDLAVIEESARQITRLLSDLLDLKKIEAGKIRIEPRELDAQEFLAEATALGRLQARQRRVAFTVDVEPGLKIWADPKRLEQALANLVANALKFSKDGGSVAVEARRAPGGVDLSVRDSGPGISPDDLRRLFSPYVQGAAGRKVAGTGLGLAIARKLVTIHGGAIRVDSGPGQGSKFALFLPEMALDATPPTGIMMPDGRG